MYLQHDLTPLLCPPKAPLDCQNTRILLFNTTLTCTLYDHTVADISHRALIKPINVPIFEEELFYLIIESPSEVND